MDISIERAAYALLRLEELHKWDSVAKCEDAIYERCGKHALHAVWGQVVAKRVFKGIIVVAKNS